MGRVKPNASFKPGALERIVQSVENIFGLFSHLRFTEYTLWVKLVAIRQSTT